VKIVPPYQAFSKVYDKVVSPEKYDKWEKFIDKVWRENYLKPKSMLDLACGTGINAIRYSKRGIQVFGVDASEDMLKIAMRKSHKVKYFKADFLNFSMPHKVDAVICLDFATNYLLTPNDILFFVNRVYRFLNPHGIFIFDFKPLGSFANEEKHAKYKDFKFDWVCDLTKSPIVNIQITITTKSGTQTREHHIERGYGLEEMKQIIAKSKFKYIKAYNNCLPTEPSENSKLIQIVLKKENNIYSNNI